MPSSNPAAAAMPWAAAAPEAGAADLMTPAKRSHSSGFGGPGGTSAVTTGVGEICAAPNRGFPDASSVTYGLAQHTTQHAINNGMDWDQPPRGGQHYDWAHATSSSSSSAGPVEARSGSAPPAGAVVVGGGADQVDTKAGFEYFAGDGGVPLTQGMIRSREGTPVIAGGTGYRRDDESKKKAAAASFSLADEGHLREPLGKKCRVSRSLSPTRRTADSAAAGASAANDADSRAKVEAAAASSSPTSPTPTSQQPQPPSAAAAATAAPPPKKNEPRPQVTKLDEVRDLVADVVRGGNPNVGGVREARRASVDVLLHVLTSHPSDGPVQEYCCVELFDMVHRDPRCAPAVVGCSALLQAVVRGMELNSEYEALQEMACRALWLLSVEDRHRTPVILAGACGAVSKALATHGTTSESVAAAALGAIKPLSVNSKGRTALAAGGECAASVARVMLAHPDAVKVQAEGCSVLSNLAVDMTRRTVAALTAEEMTAVLRAMRMHPSSEIVQKQACFALKNLSHQYANLARMVKCAGGPSETPESLLRTAVQNFPEICQRQGQIVLQRLEHFRAGPVSVTSSGSIVSSSSRKKARRDGNGSVRSGRSGRSSRSKTSTGSRRKRGSGGSRRGGNKKGSSASVCSASSANSHRTGASNSSGSEDGAVTAGAAAAAAASVVSNSASSAAASTLKPSESPANSSFTDKDAAAAAAAGTSSHLMTGNQKLGTIFDSSSSGSVNVNVNRVGSLIERPDSASTTQSSLSASSAPPTFAAGNKALQSLQQQPPRRESMPAGVGLGQQRRFSGMSTSSAPAIVAGGAASSSAAASNPFLVYSEASRSNGTSPSPGAGASAYPRLSPSPGLPPVREESGGGIAGANSAKASTTKSKPQAPRSHKAAAASPAADDVDDDRLLLTALDLCRRGDARSSFAVLERRLQSKISSAGGLQTAGVPRVLNCLGYVRSASGDLSGAAVCYERSVRIQCRFRGGGAKSERELASTLLSLGVLRLKGGDAAGAEKALTEAINIKGGKSNLSSDIAPELEALGDARAARGDADGADLLYRDAAKCYYNDGAANKGGGVGKGISDGSASLFRLAVVLSKIGKILVDRGDFASARSFLEFALEYKRTSSPPGTSGGPEGTCTSSARELAVALNDVGYVFVLVDDLESAVKAYEESADVQRRSLVGTSDETDRSFADTVTTLGVLRRRMDEPSSARACFEDALDVRRHDCERAASTRGRGTSEAWGERSEALVTLLRNLGEVCRDEGDDEAALAYTEEALENLKALILREEALVHAKLCETGRLGRIRDGEENTKEQKRLMALHNVMSDLLLSAADILARNGDVRSAQAAYEGTMSKKIDIYGPTQVIDDGNVLAVMVDVLEGLGYCAAALGNVSAAIDRYEHATKLRKRILGPNILEEDFAKGLHTLGVLYLKKGDLSAAQESLTEALDIRRYLRGDEPTARNATFVLESLIGLSDAHCRRERFDDAEVLTEEALAIVEDSPDLDARRFVDLQRRLGHFAGRRGDLCAATEHFRMALEATKEASQGEMTGCIRGNGDVIKALQELGYVLAVRGDYDKSIEAYDESLTLLQEVSSGEEAADSDAITSTLRSLDALHKAMESGYVEPSEEDFSQEDGTNALWEDDHISDQNMFAFMEDLDFR